jgi:hypothetical protein
MPDGIQELIVFPTELALRRYQQEQALKEDWVDASGHTTFPRLLRLCLPYAHLKGVRMDGATRLLMRNQVVEVASGHFAGQGTLGRLSDAALSDVLDQLVREMASLPQEWMRIVDWMLDHSRSAKLRQLGTLYSVWRANIGQEGYADALDVNLAVLQLLQGGKDQWPPLLRDARQIVFRSIRWFNPFEEACATALNQKAKVRVETALPPAHSEASGDRLGQQIRSEIMAEPWSMWAEELGDALAVESPDLLQLEEIERIGFSRSAGAYGEIEDLARRICWELTENGIPANRMALVVPDIGNVQDIIPHVFGRFRIPYFFRRGRPVLSSPVVKSGLAWLAFPLRPERDALIDLIRNPAIDFAGREAVVEALLQAPPRVQPLFFRDFMHPDRLSGKEALELLNDRINAPEDHFNAEALSTLGAALERLGNHVLPLRDLVDLLQELLENETIKPRDSHEQGVWILNPHDAAGLDFDTVLFAGLNEGEFPVIPQQDALLSDTERLRLRSHLEEQGRHLPALALPRTDVQLVQQSVLFLSVLGMARRQLVLSYQSADQEGGEKSESEYFRNVWNTAGWPVQDPIRPGPYDAWRLAQLPEENLFEKHIDEQQSTEPENRKPMPGESFLTLVPLPLCRAGDEALQAAVGGGTAASLSTPEFCSLQTDEEAVVPPGSIGHLVDMLRIEAQREAFLNQPVDERTPSVYCGRIPGLKAKIAAWLESKRELSPTSLEKLAQCRYVFLLEQVFGLREERMAEDTPDPLDRGSLIHSILKEIYSAMAVGPVVADTRRMWAVKGAAGWHRRADGGTDAMPLVVMKAEHEEDYVAFAREKAVECMERIELGHPGVWAAEREKVLEQILNMVRADAQRCEEEGRFPALFELRFGGETAVDLGLLRLKGTIDRIDLIFSAGGQLDKVRVLDYKGVSRARSGRDDYLDEIRSNLDCQLPVYALAAQQVFFGAFNSEHVNSMTEAGYLFYDRALADVLKKSAKSLIPMDEPGLLADFLEILSGNIARLKEGDFSVDPLIAAYNDYESICRTTAVERGEVE